MDKTNRNNARDSIVGMINHVAVHDVEITLADLQAMVSYT